jgi:hypothetical protein
MIVATFLLVPGFLVILWGFFKYSPNAEEHESVVLFNTISVIAALASAGAYIVFVYLTMSGGPDAHWWPYMAAVLSITIVALVLGFSAFIRNLVYSRKRSSQNDDGAT